MDKLSYKELETKAANMEMMLNLVLENISLVSNIRSIIKKIIDG